MKTKIFVVFVAVLLTGCAAQGNSYSQSGQAVPVSELGSRGAQFAGQAQQFHQANMAINLCPQGTAEKNGGGSVHSGAGDQSGRVSYSISTTSVAHSKCDFGAANPVPKPTPEARSRTKVAEKR